MEKKNENVLDRKLRDCDFESVAEAIKGAKESGGLKHVELVENLASSLKGKDVHAVVEIISSISLLLDVKELAAIMECTKEIMRVKMIREMLERAKEGDSTTEDMIATLMLQETMKKD